MRTNIKASIYITSKWNTSWNPQQLEKLFLLLLYIIVVDSECLPCLIPFFMKFCYRFLCYTTPDDSIDSPSHSHQYFVVQCSHVWAHSPVSPSWLNSCRCPHQQYADRGQKNISFKRPHPGADL